MKFLNTAFLGLMAAAVTSTTSAFSVTTRSSPYSQTVSFMSSDGEASSVDTQELFQRALLKKQLEFNAKSSVVSETAAAPKAAASVEPPASAFKTEEPVRKTVYVGNLPFTTTKDQISNMFVAAGIKVVTVAMPMNPNMIDENTGLQKSKGFAFVDVESEEMIVAAVEALNEVELDGRTMRVNKLLPKEEVAARQKTRDRNYTTDGKKKMYVGNLPFEATEEEISVVFAEYGEVSDIYLPMRDGNPRGFCFVTMDTADADKAMTELSGYNFQGRDLVVNEPLKKGEKPPARNTRPAFKLYVGNLSFYTSEETLCNVFSEFGEVFDCYLPTDPNTEQARGFGFITMEQSEGEVAINELDGLELDGRFIRVNEAQGKRRPVQAYDNEGGEE